MPRIETPSVLEEFSSAKKKIQDSVLKEKIFLCEWLPIMPKIGKNSRTADIIIRPSKLSYSTGGLTRTPHRWLSIRTITPLFGRAIDLL